MADLTTRLYKEQTDESKKFQNEQLAAYQKQISVLTSRLTNQYESMIPAEVDTKVHLSQPETVNKNEYDVFISHATEDKESFANELYRILTEEYGFKVWYDAVAMKWGDSLRTQIDNGLKTSKFGIVILSKHYISKGWTKYELDGLFQREMSEGKTILRLVQGQSG